MQYEQLMRYFGYTVRLQDQGMNPVAAEANRILVAKYGDHVEAGAMTGTRVAEAWAAAEKKVRDGTSGGSDSVAENAAEG